MKMRANFMTYERNKMKLNFFDKLPDSFFYLTGIKSLDRIKGIPAGEITEIVGPSGVGKSNLLHQIASYIAYKYPEIPVVYIDADNTFDPKKIEIYRKYLDTNEEILRKIIVYRPSDFKIFANYISKNFWERPIFILIDSIPNLVFPNMNIDDSQYKYTGRLERIIYKIGNFLNKFLLQSPSSVILTANQVRFSPQVVSQKSIYEKKIGLNPWSLWSQLRYIPALGKIWSNFVDNRFLIHKIRRNLRALQIIFSRHWRETTLLLEVKNEIIFK